MQEGVITGCFFGFALFLFVYCLFNFVYCLLNFVVFVCCFPNCLFFSSIISSRSEESSDSSHHSRNKSDSNIILPSALLQKPYDPDDKDEPHRHTALPTVFRRQRPPARMTREERLTASGGRYVKTATICKQCSSHFLYPPPPTPAVVLIVCSPT